MLRYEAALDIIAGLKLPPSLEKRPLPACLGMTLAEDLFARVPSPPYTNSAMDGFAVRHVDLQKPSLKIVGTIFAEAPREEMPEPDSGCCVRIMTGGLLPAWADTVIPVENAALSGSGGERVRFTCTAERGDHIRLRGSDLDEGALLLKAGTGIDPERMMVAAAFGHAELHVLSRPRVIFISTGNELREPGQSLRPGELYNSSKYFLLGAAAKLGLHGADAPIHLTLSDDEEAVRQTILPFTVDGIPTIIMTTGAVSQGDADFLPRVATGLGFQTLFHKVAIRPGKPVYLAKKENHLIWLGLPGNAISTSVCWHAFARPLLAQMAHLPRSEKKTLILQNEVRKPEGLRCFYRAEVNGQKAWIPTRQGSAELATSINHAAYVELPEGFSRIPAETRVEAIIV